MSTFLENKISQNILAWIFVLLVSIIAVNGNWSSKLIIVSFISVPIYINNLLILPKLANKISTRGVLFFILNILLFTIISGLILKSINNSASTIKVFTSALGFIIIIISFGSAIKLARDNFIRKQQIQKAELALLKNQLNPHFLFNTLNNLYGLSVNKSDKLPDLMLKLSELLRYSLYETHETKVELHKELEYLNNYIALEQIRLEHDTEITFETDVNHEAPMIAPMLLIVFVENSFKHLGANSENKKYVNIRIQADKNGVTFTCENSINNNTSKPIESNGGIGLKNAKKRLHFMYPNDHSLTIAQGKNSYKVVLKLNEL